MEGTVTAGMLGVRGIACAGAEAAPVAADDVGDAVDAAARGRWLGRLLWIAFAYVPDTESQATPSGTLHE
jgi:hypothetical protein